MGLVASIGPKVFLAKFSEALEDINEGFRFLKLQDDTFKNNTEFEICEFFNVVAIYYGEIGDFEKSIEYNKKCLQIREKLGNKVKIAMSYNNLGHSNKLFGNYEESFSYYRKALRISNELGNKHGKAITLLNLGRNYDEFGETEKAFNCFNESLEIFLTLGNTNDLANCYFNIANLYKRINNLKKSLDLLELSYNIYENNNNDLQKIIVLFYLLQVNLLLGNKRNTEEIFNKMNLISNKTNIERINQYNLLSQALLLKESNSARDHAKAEAILDIIISKPSIPFHEVVIAIMIKCEVLLIEISDNITDENKIIEELENTLIKLVSFAEKQKNYVLIVESYWLSAQLNYLRKDEDTMKKYLLEANEIAERKKLYHLLKKMSLESNRFFDESSSMENYFKNSILMLEQNRIDMIEKEDSSKNFIPLKLLVLTKTGQLIYNYDFQRQQSVKSTEDHLVTGFLSAINAFSQKLFAGFIDHMKIDNNQIILKYSDPVFFYLVFQGKLYNAVSGLTKIVTGIKNDIEIWKSIKFHSNANQVLIDQNKIKSISEIVNNSIMDN